MVALALLSAKNSRGHMELWVAAAANLRSFLRGWSANVGSADKALHKQLVAELVALDSQADQRVFSEAKWEHRYANENKVLSIFRAEEEYWHRRGGVKWITQGDANTHYFMLMQMAIVVSVPSCVCNQSRSSCWARRKSRIISMISAFA